MQLPNAAELQEAVRLVAGPDATFEALGPESRIQIIGIAQAAMIAEALNGCADELADVSEWFRQSKVYYP